MSFIFIKDEKRMKQLVEDATEANPTICLQLGKKCYYCGTSKEIGAYDHCYRCSIYQDAERSRWKR